MKHKPNKAPIGFPKEDFCFNNAKKKENYHPSIKIVQVNLESNIDKKQFCSPQLNKKTTPFTHNNDTTNRPSSQRKTEDNNEKKRLPLAQMMHSKTPSIKEDIRKRNCRSLVKPQLYTTPKKKEKDKSKNKSEIKPKKKKSTPNINSNIVNGTGNGGWNWNGYTYTNANSNCILTTNFTETKTEKKKSKGKATNSKVSDTSLTTIQHLRNIFLTSTLKKTIIIDEKGNTNLMIKPNANTISNENNVNVNGNGNKNSNPMTLYRKTFCTSTTKVITQPFINEPSNKKFIKKPSESDKSTVIEPIDGNSKEDNNYNGNRNVNIDNDNIKEALFSLLNNNLIHMKNSIQNYNDTSNYNDDSHLFYKSHQFEVFTQKERDEINCFANANDQDNNHDHYNDNNNSNHGYNDKHTNNRAEILTNNSFLDSYCKEDLFHSFIKSSLIKNEYGGGNHHTESPSFNYSTTIRNQTDSIINANYDQTECCEDNMVNKDNPITTGTLPYLFNPRLLLKKAKKKPIAQLKEKSNDNCDEDKGNLNEANNNNKEKCCIF